MTRSITSSSAPAARVACWLIGSQRIRRSECCCSRPAHPTPWTPFGCPRCGAGCSIRKKGQSVDPDELRDYVKARVAAYKYLRRIWLLDELPKGAAGKVQKRDITAPTSESAP
jgi:acyl-CoA synthetase (AMP-forming)/AMP-acid ligase II